jgi:chromosomal replication initiation ATPase DnaA
LTNLDIAAERDTPPRGRDAPGVDALRGVAQIVAAAVAAAFIIPIGELRATTRRSATTAFARQNAMYLAHVALGLNYTDVGRAFGRDRTTAAHACRIVEDRRTDPGFDARLASLEHLLRRSRRIGRIAA